MDDDATAPDPFEFAPAPRRALRHVVEMRAALVELETILVRLARASGDSWTEIAIPLGVTRQSARLRHRAHDPRRVRPRPQQPPS